jgi:hypothetical protein
MTTSNEIKNISAALVAFHKEVGKIAKDAKNPFFKSKYASLSGILDAVDEPLVNNGLAIVQFPDGDNGLTTRLVHISGEWMESTYTMKPVKDTPQDRGSMLTYQRRYAIGAILSLNIDEDDDGNQSSGKGQQQPVKQVNVTETIKADIDNCQTEEQLKAIYNKNKAAIESNPSILQLMKDKKSKITGKQLNNA